MKYEKPNMELIALVEREVFMTQSPGVENGGYGDGGDWSEQAP